jgi:hypothetical protein
MGKGAGMSKRADKEWGEMWSKEKAISESEE